MWLWLRKGEDRTGHWWKSREQRLIFEKLQIVPTKTGIPPSSFFFLLFLTPIFHSNSIPKRKKKQLCNYFFLGLQVVGQQFLQSFLSLSLFLLNNFFLFYVLRWCFEFISSLVTCLECNTKYSKCIWKMSETQEQSLGVYLG